MFSRLITGIILLVLTTTAACAQQDSSAQADRAFNWIVDSQIYPGFRVIVTRDNDVVYQRDHGYADLENQSPVGANDRFRIYSLSKTFTAVAIMQLVESDRLDLHAPISVYMENLPDHIAQLTTHQLLTHTSGVRHYGDDEWFAVSQHQCESPADAFDVFINDPLQIEPGSGYHYSTYGYVLLSAIIEAASGDPYEYYMRWFVFHPAGMDATALDGREIAGYRTVAHYQYTNEEGLVFRRAFPEVNSSCKFGGGGYVSTAEDLVRFGNALIDGTLISQESLDLMTTTFVEGDGLNSPAYGYGITPGSPSLPAEAPPGIENFPPLVQSMVETFAGAEFGDPIHNNGGAHGAFAKLIIYPDTNVVMALTANNREPMGNIPSDVIAAAFGKE